MEYLLQAVYLHKDTSKFQIKTHTEANKTCTHSHQVDSVNLQEDTNIHPKAIQWDNLKVTFHHNQLCTILNQLDITLKLYQQLQLPKLHTFNRRMLPRKHIMIVITIIILTTDKEIILTDSIVTMMKESW